MEKLRVARIERDSGRVFCCREGDGDNGHEEEENESKNEWKTVEKPANCKDRRGGIHKEQAAGESWHTLKKDGRGRQCDACGRKMEECTHGGREREREKRREERTGGSSRDRWRIEGKKRREGERKSDGIVKKDIERTGNKGGSVCKGFGRGEKIGKKRRRMRKRQRGKILRGERE